MIKVNYLVTSALPYVNNELHLGHFVGCLLPADVYTRFLRSKNENVVYVSGTDEYGTPILVAAKKEGKTPQEIVDKYYKIQKETLEKFNISTDIFSRTTSPEHTKVVQDFYYKLKQNNFIYRKEIEQLYCEKCGIFLPDRYVEGECPHCGKDARGDQCDDCGNPLEPTQLVNSYCITCKEKPSKKKSEHVFFNLPKAEKKLKEWVDGNDGLFQNSKNFASSFIKQGLKEKDISRDMEWGVPIPDAEGLVFYVWFDAPLGYITFSKQIGKENWWKDKNTQLVHFLGKDNIVFHTIYFPGMLIANEEYVLPSKVASYEFLTFGGSKLSKSKGRMITAREALETYPADCWRFALISLLPENKDTDFTWEIFQEIINNDLNDTIGNLVHRTLTFTKRFYSGKVSKPELSEKDKEMLEKINESCKKSEELMKEIQLKKALHEITALARLGNQFITAEEPWKNEARRQNVVYVSLCIVKALSVMLSPFIPESAGKMKKFLNLKSSEWDDAKVFEESFEINDFETLFSKVSDEEIKKTVEKFAKKKEGKPVIKYEDFEKLDLRTAVVKAAEKVEGAEKLIKLTVDIGNEERIIVAGMAPYYSNEEIIGKKIVVLANLEPRKLRGIESQGMLLAAEKDGKVSLLTTDKDVEEGANVR